MLLLLVQPASAVLTIDGEPLPMADAIALAQESDPWLQASLLEQQAYLASSQAAATQPDPVVSMGFANLPTDTFDFDPEGFNQFFWIFMVLQFVMVFCVLYIMYFAAKSIKTAQLKRKVKFGDFVGDFFLLWMYPIGVWIEQPIINKIVDDYTMENFEA